MKTSPAHLPEHIQSELQEITDIIVKKVQPEMVILFGSYGRGDYVELDRYVENGITYEYSSDYDILVITKKEADAPPGFGKEVRRQIKRERSLPTNPHVIFHSLAFVNHELSEGHYFFVDMVKDGAILYNPNNIQLTEPRILSPTDRVRISQMYFDNWFKDANDFYDSAMTDFEKGKLKIAIFLLHQATECYLTAISLVFTHYKPKLHDLDRLYPFACHEDARFKKVFPQTNDEEKRLFQLLVRAYIDSRYKIGYTVNPDDLQWLATRVQLLKELTEEICKEKIESFIKK